LYDLFENKLATLTEMNSLGWEAYEAAWFWRRKLLAWEDQVTECSQLLNYIVLQVGVVDRRVWRLNPSTDYSVSSTYQFLATNDSRHSSRKF
jgi:hypothetical protein